jgi:hypothetical protein
MKIYGYTDITIHGYTDIRNEGTKRREAGQRLVYRNKCKAPSLQRANNIMTYRSFLLFRLLISTGASRGGSRT